MANLMKKIVDINKRVVVQEFEKLLKNERYKEATKIYWGMAYMYQKEFHGLIEKYDANDIIFDILHGYHQMGEIEDQI